MSPKTKSSAANKIWKVLKKELFQRPSDPETFNFYLDTDPEMDSEGAPEIRRKNLRAYLEAASEPPTTLVVGPAPGWRGTPYTGIPYVSQLQLLRQDFPLEGERTSQDMRLTGEKVDKKLWEAFLPFFPEVFLWPAFPLHARRPGQPRTNRTPALREVGEFLPLLEGILDALEPGKVVAIGGSGRWALQQIDRDFESLKHPGMSRTRTLQRRVEKLLEPEG